MKLRYKGIVHPWFCDVMGHMATRHYMAMFDEASYQLIAESTGWNVNEEQWLRKGWADVRHEIEYKRELKSGTLVEIEGGVTKVGRTSLTINYVMRDKMADKIVAIMNATTVLYDLEKRCSMALTESIRNQIEAE